MIDKIKEVKNKIITRIDKAISDESKTISPEGLKMLSHILDEFEKTELGKNDNEITTKLPEGPKPEEI